MKTKLISLILLLTITATLILTGCGGDTLSFEANEEAFSEGKDEGYTEVSIGDDTYTWLEYTGFIPPNTLVLARYNGGRPYNYFVPIIDGTAKIARSLGWYVEFSEIDIQPNGEMTAYIKITGGKVNED